MVKRKAATAVEFILIGVFVAIFTMVFWGQISKTTLNLLGLSSVSENTQASSNTDK